MTRAEKQQRRGGAAVPGVMPAGAGAGLRGHEMTADVSLGHLDAMRLDGTRQRHRHRRSVAVEPAGGDVRPMSRGTGGSSSYSSSSSSSSQKSGNAVAPKGYTLAGDLPPLVREDLIAHFAAECKTERMDPKKGSSMLRLLTAAVGSHRAALMSIKSFSVKTWASQVLAASAYHIGIDPYEFAHISAQSVYDSTDQFPQADSHARGRLCVRRTGPDAWNFRDYKQSKTEGPRDGKALLVWSDRPAGFRLRKPGAPGLGGANTLAMRQATLELIKNRELPSDAEDLLGSTSSTPVATASVAATSRSGRIRKIARRARGALAPADDSDSPYIRSKDSMDLAASSAVRRSTRPRKKITYSVDHDTDADDDAATSDEDAPRDDVGRAAGARGSGPRDGGARGGTRGGARGGALGGALGGADYKPDMSPDVGAGNGPMHVDDSGPMHVDGNGPMHVDGNVDGNVDGRVDGNGPMHAEDTSAGSGPMHIDGNQPMHAGGAPTAPKPPRLRLRKSLDIFDHHLGITPTWTSPSWSGIISGARTATHAAPTAAEDSTSTTHSLTMHDLPVTVHARRPRHAGSLLSPGIPPLGIDGCTGSCCLGDRLPLYGLSPTPALSRSRSMEREPSVSQMNPMEVVSSFDTDTDADADVYPRFDNFGPGPSHALGALRAAPARTTSRQQRVAEERRNPMLAIARRNKEAAAAGPPAGSSGPPSPSSVSSKASSAMSFGNSRDRHIQSKRLKMMIDVPSVAPDSPTPPDSPSGDDMYHSSEADMALGFPPLGVKQGW